VFSRFRVPVLVALAATLLGLAVALSIQIALLGAWGLGKTVRELPLVAAANAQAGKLGDTQVFEFDTAGGPAVAQARDIQVATRDVLAVSIETVNATGKLRTVLGWRSTRDLRRAVSATAPMPAGAEPRTTTILLSGHAGWKEAVTQVGLGFDSPRGESGRVTVSRFELIPATPAGGLRLMAREWFDSQSGIVKASEAANRLLPLSLWIALAALIAVASAGLVFRHDPLRRSQALAATGVVVTLLALAATIAGNQWPGLSSALLGGVLIALALLLVDPPVWPRALGEATGGNRRYQARWLLVLVLFAVGAWLVPAVAAIAAMPLLIVTAQKLKPWHWPIASALLLLLPLLYLCAAAQQYFPVPALLSPLADPTATLTNVAVAAAGLPAVLLTLLALHWLWPAPAASARWSLAAAAAAAWALAGTGVVLSVPRIAVQLGGSGAFIGLMLPFLACLLLALWPKFTHVAVSAADTVGEQSLSEDDLSQQAIALLTGHGDRLRAALARGERGTARQAAIQMRRIASGARATALAELQVALAEDDLTGAAQAASRLQDGNTPDEFSANLLLELAHRNNDQPRVIALAPFASKTAGNVRAHALAALLVNGVDAARSVLAGWPDESLFAREIAELHLLQNEVQAAQQAMVNTGIALDDPIGQAYMARLGWRVQGIAPYVRSVSRLALWHPQLGAAQAAQAEILLAQGNLDGARARFLLATKLDPLLWPLARQLQTIDGRIAQTTSSAEPAPAAS